MAGYLVSDNRKVTTHRFMEMKQKGEKISMLTSYDYTMAGIVDKAGIDAIQEANKDYLINSEEFNQIFCHKAVIGNC